jgi:hypothetical protein
VALVNEAVDVMRRSERAPHSPLSASVSAEMRREYRRHAVRLRGQKVGPRYPNLHSAENLAGIYERTAARDEILEKVEKDFRRISLELKQLRKEDPEIEKAVVALVDEAARLAEEHGPGSEAAERHRLLVSFGCAEKEFIDRRRKPRAVSRPNLTRTEARYLLTAAEFLDDPPEGEAVIAIPPEGSGSGRPRILIRIGVGEASWIGSFEAGGDSFNTVALMPDERHLFVSADGAGYIIDLLSRTFVEQIGTEITGVMADSAGTLLVVVHGSRRLEAFGRDGRLWKTGAIGSARIRHMDLGATTIIGQGVHPLLPGWSNFSVDLATGKVRFGDPR